MTTSKLEVIAPATEPVIITHRFIKAPAALIFTAWTTPEHMKQWLGPRELEMISCEVDLRVGGGYRYVHRAPDGTEYAFSGKYLEIDRPRRMVCTFVFEAIPNAEAVDTLTRRKGTVARWSPHTRAMPPSRPGTDTCPAAWKPGCRLATSAWKSSWRSSGSAERADRLAAGSNHGPAALASTASASKGDTYDRYA